MATLKEEFELLKAKILAGKGGETIHVIYHDQEKKKKLAPGTQTRFQFNFGTNDSYRKAYAEWERVLSIVKDIGVARHIVSDAFLETMQGLTDEKLKALTGTDAETLDAEAKAARPGPPRAEIPDWAR